MLIFEPTELRYKGHNHILLAEELGIDPDAALCIMAQWWPGHDEDFQPYLRPDGTIDEERQDDELWDYILYFWNLKIPRTKNPTCSCCVAPFKIIADAYFARYPLIIMQASRGASKAQPLDALKKAVWDYRVANGTNPNQATADGVALVLRFGPELGAYKDAGGHPIAAAALYAAVSSPESVAALPWLTAPVLAIFVAYLGG